MNEQRIKDRIEGRKHADAVLDLACEELDSISPDFRIAYWERMHEAVIAHLTALGIDLEPPRPKLVPMDDAEAKRFEKTAMPFGKHAGLLVDQVAYEDLHYLDWLVRATEEDHFKENLRRWLARKEVQDELENELGGI